MTNAITNLTIRPCGADDLAALESAFPPPGAFNDHRYRYRWQQAGKSLYMIAWIGGMPVGHLDLQLPGHGGEMKQRLLPDYPELNALAVVPTWQSRGIGTALIATAECLLIEHGSTKACLGVNPENPRARRLYERLGYHPCELGIVDEKEILRDESGLEYTYTEKVVYLVKALSKA